MAHGHAETKGAMPGAMQRLAEAVCAFRPEAISPAGYEQAKLLLLDTLGCGIAGQVEEASHAVLATVAETGGAPRCSVIGQPIRTGMPQAVLANGTLIRVLDLNDYVVGAGAQGGEIGGHPSDNIPVALAVGEACGRSGRDILAAIALGYEIYGRGKDLIERNSSWDGVSVSALVAPAMAGWLMGLDAERLAQALALSVSRAATSAVVRSGDISAAKSVSNALVAQAGVQAAMLARHGLTGPLSVVEHPRGMRALFNKAEVWPAVVAPFRGDGYVMQASVKAYPCLATGQSLVAAALQLHERIGGDVAKLSRIRVVIAGYPFLHRQKDDPGRIVPLSREAADHSFNFLVAASLIDGAFGLEQFDNERWFDPAVTALMARLEIECDETWNARAPGSYPCAIVATGKDGREYRVEVPYPPGFSRGGVARASVLDKFRAVTAPHLAAARQQAAIDAAMAFDESPSCAALMAALTPAMPGGNAKR